MNLTLECEQEDDGRWLAEVLELPGALAYGGTQDDAMAKAEALALRVLAERLERGEVRPLALSISLPAAACANGLRSRPSASWRPC
jgi:predicted RNase H-like HicB family nuclease